MAGIDWTTIREEALGDFTLAALPPSLKLPALPHAVSLFVEKSNDPKTTTKDLAKIIETDAGLTLELFKYINSSFVGLRNKAKNVHQAISLLGIRQSKTFIVTTGMQAAIAAKKSKLINQSCFWNASFQKALFAKEVAKLLKADVDAAFAGSLLQDYLLPVITNDLFDHYLQFVGNRAEQPRIICEFERNSFGWDHALAGACLAHRWHLPDQLVCAILYHHHGLRILMHPVLGRSSVAAVAISALLPDQLRQDYEGLEQLVKLDRMWPAFDLQTLAQAVDDHHETQGLGVRNDFPLIRRCRAVFDDEAVYNDGMLAAAAT